MEESKLKKEKLEKGKVIYSLYDNFNDAYFWYRGIKCDHATAIRLAHKETA